ncbi:MAG: hypothetical protein LBM93_11655 [Oscillospiraceae bacterium]|jgi:Tfp pilus assembly pilus retraction ATPase PilT|nr:hypothetical protein [Oscillospiraceae bacterium]
MPINIEKMNINPNSIKDTGLQKLDILLQSGQRARGTDVHLMVGSVPKVRVFGELEQLNIMQKRRRT